MAWDGQEPGTPLIITPAGSMANHITRELRKTFAPGCDPGPPGQKKPGRIL